MSSVEIEDVLSSIRRLVSEDLRPAAAQTRAPAAAGPGPDKLILTPALRVVSEDAPAPLGQMVAGLGAAVDAYEEPWESETGDAGPMDRGPAAEATGRARLHLAEAMRADIAAAGAPEVAPAPMVELAEEAPAAAAAEVVGLTVAAEGVALTAPDAAGDPAGEVPEGSLADRVAEVLAEEILAQSATTTPAPQVPGWAQEGEDEGAETLATAGATLEPDRDWADAAEAEALEELSDEAAIPDAAPYARQEGPALDDEALRDLVRELIVQELQGPLGERITRNIRKLVRAEIARALASDDLL